MKKNFKAGFTLIELLVVIAIIGILASVVLASLNSARSKGKDAAVKSNMANARAQASLYYNDNNLSYLNVCTGNTAGGTKGIASFVTGTTNAGGTGVICNDIPGTSWALASSLPQGGFWCVDGSGISRGKNAAGVAYTAIGTAVATATFVSGGTTCN